jgi:hypothetical protein
VSLLQEIPASPFRVKVDPSHDASKVKAEGPGLSKAGKMAVGKMAVGKASITFAAWVLSRPRGAYLHLMWQQQCLAAAAVKPVRLVLKVKPL